MLELGGSPAAVPVVGVAWRFAIATICRLHEISAVHPVDPDAIVSELDLARAVGAALLARAVTVDAQ